MKVGRLGKALLRQALTKGVPIVGGLIGAGIDGTMTKTIGTVAINTFLPPEKPKA